MYKLLTLVLGLGLCILFVLVAISLILAGDIELNGIGEFLDYVQTMLNSIRQNPQTLVVLIGDFNAHFSSTNPEDNSIISTRLYRWLECNALTQLMDEPTRVTQHSATVLDLIITNSPGYFVDYGAFSPPANCDHSFIYGKIYISYEKRKAFKRHIWDFSNINAVELNEELTNLNWDECFERHLRGRSV